MKRMFASDEEKPSVRLLKYIGVFFIILLVVVGFDEHLHFGVSCSIHTSISGEDKDGTR